jgi:hypothetical protein
VTDDPSGFYQNPADFSQAEHFAMLPADVRAEALADLTDAECQRLLDDPQFWLRPSTLASLADLDLGW